MFCRLLGDLTHAKYQDERRSKQFEREWEEYARVLRETGVTTRVPWLDIRGNHGDWPRPFLSIEMFCRCYISLTHPPFG